MQTYSRTKFIVSGFVQGVGYRFFVYKFATKLGIKGYAKNLYDGTVEVVAEGSRESVATLESYLKQGPSHSNVERVTAFELDFRGDFSSFDIY